MFNIKYRRTRKYRPDGTQIYSTLNGTFSPPRYINRDNRFDIICQRKGCSRIPLQVARDASGQVIRCCRATPYRNPIAGWRKQLDCGGLVCPVGAQDTYIQTVELPYSGPAPTFVPLLQAGWTVTPANPGARHVSAMVLGAEAKVQGRQVVRLYLPTASAQRGLAVNTVKIYDGDVLKATAPLLLVGAIKITRADAAGSLCRRCGGTGCPGSNSSGEPNPFIDCSGCPKGERGNVYVDNYAKSCACHPQACYQPVIKRIQNRNGYTNYKYNYSSEQYLNRRCRTHDQLAFNFQCNRPIDTSPYTDCSNSNIFPAGCANCTTPACGPKGKSSHDQIGGRTGPAGHTDYLLPSKPNCWTNAGPTGGPKVRCGIRRTCAGVSVCDSRNTNCCAVYKPNNRTFSQQGAVSGGSRINRLKYQTKLHAQTVILPNNLYSMTAQRPGPKEEGPSALAGKVKSQFPFRNSVNGQRPVSLYRTTFPWYKRGLSKRLYTTTRR